MIRTIGWAIVHSVWQAGVIAVLTAAILFMLRKSSAATRYWVAVVGLVVMTVAPVVTVAGAARSAESGVRSTESGGSFTVTGGSVVDGVVQSSDARTPPSALRSPLSARVAPTLQQRLEALFPWIVALWLLGVILFSIRTAAGLVWARKLTRTGTTAVSDQLRGVAARIADNMGVRVAVRVLESSRVTVPMLVGWLRPVILMPASVLIGLTPQQIEAILAHELAHVKRNDYAVNLLQTVVEILYFYHPAAWWLSGRIREERENACDELAVSACGGDRIFYSRVLLTVEESRGEVPALAVAATGGSLSRRIHRLLGAEQAHLDIGPRWYAGVFTIGLAVVGAGGLVDEGFPHTSAAHPKVAVAQDRNTKPDTVIRFTGDGSLEQRWEWAEQTAKKNSYDRYWIGYLIQGDPSGEGWYHFDRTTPVSLGDNMTTLGHMRLGGNFDNIRIAGTPMQKVIGEREPHNIVVFIAYDHGKLSRVHLSSFVFPMNFNKLPVLWLEQVPDRESIAKLVAIEATTSNGDLQEDLIASVGAHTDAAAAVPILQRYATDLKQPNDVRREAVESLGRFDTQGVLTLLARLARNDREEDIRAEAVETIGNLKVLGASDTLMSFARTLTGERERSESFEALADTQGDETERLKVLVDVANHDPDSDIQGRAAEAIGELHNHDAALGALRKLIVEHPNEDVRRRAMEGIGNVTDDDRGAKILFEIVRTHPDPETRRRAVEFIGEFHDYPIFKDVAAIALSNQSIDVRRMAVETYMGNVDEAEAIAFARKVLASDAPFDVKREVIEHLESLDGGAGIPVILELVRSQKDPELRKRAIEALIESDDPKAVAALRKIQ